VSSEVVRRISGLLAFLFVSYHAWLTGFFGGIAWDYDEWCASMSATNWGVPGLALAYLLGIAVTVAHVATGAQRMVCDWQGQTETSATLRVASVVLALALALPGVVAIFRLATGSGALFVGSS
jgi:succinate dehydrogenase hydrophobic anchor subunit